MFKIILVNSWNFQKNAQVLEESELLFDLLLFPLAESIVLSPGQTQSSPEFRVRDVFLQSGLVKLWREKRFGTPL